MSFISLDECLSRNAPLLGERYEKLGTIEQGVWLNRKILLAFDEEKGWSVVKLNWVQLFLRKFFGIYQNTHFTTIFTQWKLTHYRNTALKERLEALFFNPKKYFVSWGNAEIAEAKVFLFPEEHRDLNYKKAVNRFINEHYQEGDVVLVEGVDAGKTHPDRDLKPGIPGWGWEPEKFQEPTVTPNFCKHNEMLRKIYISWAELKIQEPNFVALGKNLDHISTDIQELIDYFDPQMQKADVLIKEHYEACKTALDPYLHFLAYLENMLMNLVKNEKVALYRHLRRKDAQFCANVLHMRNLSLVSEIEKMVSQGKRVFVRAGSAHVLGDAPSHYIPEEVHACLMRQKFVILAGRGVLTKEIMELNKKSLKFK